MPRRPSRLALGLRGCGHGWRPGCVGRRAPLDDAGFVYDEFHGRCLDGLRGRHHAAGAGAGAGAWVQAYSPRAPTRSWTGWPGRIHLIVLAVVSPSAAPPIRGWQPRPRPVGGRRRVRRFAGGGGPAATSLGAVVVPLALAPASAECRCQACRGISSRGSMPRLPAACRSHRAPHRLIGSLAHRSRRRGARTQPAWWDKYGVRPSSGGRRRRFRGIGTRRVRRP